MNCLPLYNKVGVTNQYNHADGMTCPAVLPAHIPKEIMDCRAVSREVNFSSKEEIQDLWMIQQVFLGDMCLEGECATDYHTTLGQRYTGTVYMSQNILLRWVNTTLH